MNFFNIGAPSIRSTIQQTIRIDKKICKLASELSQAINDTSQNFQDQTIRTLAKEEEINLKSRLDSLLCSYDGLDKTSFINKVNAALIEYNNTFMKSVSRHNFDGSMNTIYSGGHIGIKPRMHWIEPKVISDFIEKLSNSTNPEIYAQILIKK